jgi:hypothetical protein
MPFDRNAELTVLFVFRTTSLVKKEGLRVFTLVNCKAFHDSGLVLVCTKITHAGGDIDTRGECHRHGMCATFLCVL